MVDFEYALSPDEQIDEVNEQLRLIRRKNGLTFGTDAYLLSAFTRPQPNERAADLGSGTGILALLLLARNKAKTVAAIEIQEAFADLIRRNATINGMSDRITAYQKDVRDVRPEDVGGELALVVSNPPYMRATSGKRNEHDEKFIARHEVMGGIKDFCNAAARLLKHGGRFVCVWRPDRLTELLDAMHGARLEAKRMVFVHADTIAEPSAVLVEAVKGASPSLRILPPLFLYEDRREGETKRILTARAKKIYDTCDFCD